MYIRVLHEYFNISEKNNIKFPAFITNHRYQNLKYQTDAIQQSIHIINSHNGVIIADVVGLGKSIIVAIVAHNLGLKTIIISPPHLCQQWDEEYKEYFNINCMVFSSGKIEDALNLLQTNKQSKATFNYHRRSTQIPQRRPIRLPNVTSTLSGKQSDIAYGHSIQQSSSRYFCSN